MKNSNKGSGGNFSAFGEYTFALCMFMAQLAERDSRHRKEQFTWAHTHGHTAPGRMDTHMCTHTALGGMGTHRVLGKMGTQPQAGWEHIPPQEQDGHTAPGRMGTHYTHTHRGARWPHSLRQDGNTYPQEEDRHTALGRIGTPTQEQDGHTPIQEEGSPLCVPKLAVQLL